MGVPYNTIGFLMSLNLQTHKILGLEIPLLEKSIYKLNYQIFQVELLAAHLWLLYKSIEETPITPIKFINNPTVRLDIRFVFWLKNLFLNGASMYFSSTNLRRMI